MVERRFRMENPPPNGSENNDLTQPSSAGSNQSESVEKKSFFAPEYDPNKTYEIKKEESGHFVASDPVTGKEVARVPRVEGGADRGLGGFLGRFGGGDGGGAAGGAGGGGGSGGGGDGGNGPERRRPSEFEPLPDPMLVSARIAILNAKRLDGLSQDEEAILDRDYFYIKQYAPGKIGADLNYLDSSKESEDEVIKEDELSKLDIRLTQTQFKLRQFNKQYPQLRGSLEKFDENIGQIRATHFRIGIREDKLKPENPQQLKNDEKITVEQELEQQRAELRDLEEKQKKLREEMASQAGFDVGGEKGKLLEQYEYLSWERNRARHKKLKEGVEAKGDLAIVPKDELEEDWEPTAEELSGQNLTMANVQARRYQATRLIGMAQSELERAQILPDDNPEKAEVLSNNQEILSQNQEVLQDMDRRLELLFIEAKRRGVFTDIEEDMNQKYAKYRKALADDGIRERLSAEKQNYLSTLDHDADWNAVQQREDLTDDQIEKFKGVQFVIPEVDSNGNQTRRVITLPGIRSLYAERAFDQMMAKRGRELNIRAIKKQISEAQNLPEDDSNKASGLNILYGRLRENQAPMINHRVSGEWNINNEDRRQQLIEQEKSSYRYDYWTVTLDTSSPEAFIRSAEQFVHDSIRGASKFDPQEFMRRKALVANAVVLQGKDFFQEDQRRRLRWTVETEFDYPTANVAAENSIPPLYEAIMENHIDTEGADRLRNLATLKNGKFIKSVEELEKGENEIIFAAEGHRGQLSGDIDAQRLLRDLRIKALERKMARVQVRGVDYTDKQANLLKMQYEMSDQEMNELFEDIDWDAKVTTAENYVKNAQTVLDQETSYSGRKRALNTLNRAKWELSRIKDQKEEAEDEAKSAVELAIQYFNIFGRSAKLGAPTFVMGNGLIDSSDRGHYIPIDMAVAWLQGVVLDGESTDSLKGIDERATKGQGMQGYETIGFNQAQVKKWKDAVALLKKEGFNAIWNVKTFREVINSPRANYIENNFLASYLSMQGRFVNENFREEISKDKMPWFKYVLGVIDPQGRIKPNPDKQQQLNQVRDAIELSRSIHYRFWTAAHKEWMKDHMKDMEVGTASHIDWGNHYVNLLFQNMMYKNARWATDQRQYSSRAANLISGIPLWLPDLAGFIGARNMKELIQIERKGGVDVYMMQKWMIQFKALLAGAAAVEGSAPERGERPHGLLEKPFRSFDRFRALIPDLTDPGNLHSIRDRGENIILQGQEVFASFKDVALAANIMLDYARDAQGAGTSHKEIRRIWTEYKYWMRDARAGLPRRYRGARTAYPSLTQFMEYLDKANWDGSGESALEGIFGKIDPSHNPSDE